MGWLCFFCPLANVHDLYPYIYNNRETTAHYAVAVAGVNCTYAFHTDLTGEKIEILTNECGKNRNIYSNGQRMNGKKDNNEKNWMKKKLEQMRMVTLF